MFTLQIQFSYANTVLYHSIIVSHIEICIEALEVKGSLLEERKGNFFTINSFKKFGVYGVYHIIL